MKLFLDISLRNVGYVVTYPDGRIAYCGVIKTEKDDSLKKTEDLFVRAQQIANGVMSAAMGEGGTYPPIDHVVCEAMSWPRNASSAVAMAVAWGAIAASLGCALDPSAKCDFVAVQTAKRQFANKRDAEKSEVEAGVREYYKSKYGDSVDRFLVDIKRADREHVFDALAVGYTQMEKSNGANRSRTRN